MFTSEIEATTLEHAQFGDDFSLALVFSPRTNADDRYEIILHDFGRRPTLLSSFVTEGAARLHYASLCDSVASEYLSFDALRVSGCTLMRFPQNLSDDRLAELFDWFPDNEIEPDFRCFENLGRWFAFDDQNLALHYKMRWL
ncbi:hypothetical protein [Bosea sp. TAF32]|uniref:hypothetical protein n=1 Tax=Bosea sp. TAF32 TaxID=3237482 RepID=UPI003F9323C4